MPVGPFPAGIAYDSGKGEVFVTYQGKTATSSSPASAAGISVVSDANNSVVATLPVVGGAVVYDSGKNELFVATGATNSTSIISDATNSVFAKVAAGPSPYALAYDPGRGEIFVANYDASTVTILYDTTPTPPYRDIGIWHRWVSAMDPPSADLASGHRLRPVATQ